MVTPILVQAIFILQVLLHCRLRGELFSPSFLRKFSLDRLAEQETEDTADAICSACDRVQQERIEQAILQPLLKMDYSAFLQASASEQIAPVIVEDVWKKIKEQPSTNSYLFGSLDNDGAHLYAVGDRRGKIHLDMPGFGAIGIAASLAMGVLYQNPYVKHSSLLDAVYLAYEAKRVAERNYQVGKQTDIAVILPGHDAMFLGQEALSQLEKISKIKNVYKLTESESKTIQPLLPDMGSSQG